MSDREIDFKYDDPTHTYTLGSSTLPSVTTILKPAGPIFWKPHHAVRGRDVHELCRFLDEDDLDPASVDPAYEGYLESYRKLLAAFRPAWSLIEKPDYHRALLYAGTLDRFGIVKGERTLCDIKSGVRQPSHARQTAAYAMILEPGDYLKIRRCCWYLKRDGRIGDAEYHYNPGDFMNFLQDLAEYRKNQV